MKNQAFLILLIIAVGITLTSIVANSSGNNSPLSSDNYIIVRSIEVGGTWPSEIIITYEDGTTETTELGKFRGNNFVKNIGIIHSKLNEIREKGYTLISSNGGNSDNVVVSTYVFQKNE
jgi:hypothetical protein